MSVTFELSKVEPRFTGMLFKIEELLKELSPQFKWKPFEAFSEPLDRKAVFCGQAHGFWAAVHSAFQYHLPLGLSPDHLWITIARSFAEHVTAHAEELRKRFVDWDGQKVLEVRRDNFVKGSKDNDWPGAFAEFSDKIAESIGKARDLVVCNFSTTGAIERAASQIVLMDAMQRYFEYSMRTCCGIPRITLLGETADWESIRERARALSEYGLADWVKDLDPVLEQFVLASKGEVNHEWWRSFYKFESMSGGDRITGHLTRFFTNHIRCSDDIPHCISQVPFTWHYYDQSIPMRFVAGMPFVVVENKMVQPLVCWGVNEA